jgi:hypothetical protein
MKRGLQQCKSRHRACVQSYSCAQAENSFERKDGKMNRLKKFLLDVNSTERAAEKFMRRCGLAVLIAFVGSTLIFTAQAQNPAPLSFNLTPASNAISNCMPDAKARVTVFSREDIRGVDTLELKAEGLRANTTFAVFLTELPTAPFGAAEYVGDFTTNAAGRASMRVDTVVGDAFSTTLVGSDRVRKELNHVVIWFADPVDDDFCPGPASGITTPFDGDGQAGTAVLSSKSFLPGAPLP